MKLYLTDTDLFGLVTGEYKNIVIDDKPMTLKSLNDLKAVLVYDGKEFTADFKGFCDLDYWTDKANTYYGFKNENEDENEELPF